MLPLPIIATFIVEGLLFARTDWRFAVGQDILLTV
jgi:Tfp pilus assembly protein PilZ